MLLLLLPLLLPLLRLLLRLRLVLVLMLVVVQMVVLVLLPLRQWRLMVLRPLVGEQCPCPYRSLLPVVVLRRGGRPPRLPDHRH